VRYPAIYFSWVGSVNQKNQIKMETTNNLRYTTIRTKKGMDIIIKIRLNDECKNGHNDFSLTGDTYTAGKPHTDRNWQGGGAMGDEIAELFPEFKIFADLHLCDAKGAPMHAEANGFYHLKESSKETTINYLRITEEEYNKLIISEDKDFFNYMLQALAIPERWEQEAKAAIAKLEELTGQKFKDDSVRYQYTPLSLDKLAEIGKRINEGYYNTEAITERNEAKKQALIKKQFDEIAQDRDKTINKANTEYSVKYAVLLAGLPLKNFIYYNHTNKGVFNWLDYEKKITPEQLEEFVKNVDYTQLPEGITFGFDK
jgi:hypothetical protein